MKVGVVTVTYGNRIEYLSKLVNRLYSLDITKICVVVNGTQRNKFDNLSSLKKVKFIFNLKNLGSAKGFKQGIECLRSDLLVDFLWLLDDDNLPEQEALDNLIEFYKNLKFNDSKDALLSFRPDRPNFLNALKTNNGSVMLKGKNSVLGFSIFGNNKQVTNYQDKGLRVAPYGGLFFHKDLINSIGYPDEEYFLYGDDYDFSIRISEKGGKIKLVKDSIVKDLETSFHLKEKGYFSTRYHNTNNLDQIFFSVRNGIRFELKYMVDNKGLYYINLLVYSLIIGGLLFITPRKLIIFYKGILSGINNG